MRRVSLRARLSTALVSALMAAAPMAVVAVAAPPPAVAAAAVAVPRPPYHVVRPGQTLRHIAGRYGLAWKVLAAWNGLRAPYPVHVDDVLRLYRPPAPLPPFRTWVEPVTPQSINWDPARRCPIAPVSLRRIWVYYVDFLGNRRVGSIVMHRLHVIRTQRVFRQLYDRRFRIQAMAPMAVNMPGVTDYSIVTSGWECRRVSGSTVWSQHAYGTAIDVNPVQNPMIKRGVVSPPAGVGYVGRSPYGIGMVHGAGAAGVFTANGLHWGGRWRTLKDYMHFSITNR
jgi:D-alanyl-D-alanine carboxypeptidase/LysM domain